LPALTPTSLVFGVWDSRGGTSEKRPRLIRSFVRAWDVQPLHAAAQFNSIWKSLNPDQQTDLEKEAKAKKVKLSEKGFADAPATFRKLGPAAAKNIPEFRDGSPNPERRVLGGVLVNGAIERDVTINLMALRAICGSNEAETQHIRRYVLSLALLAATAEMNLFLREGCHLRISDDGIWKEVCRRGEPNAVDLSSDKAQEKLLEYAEAAASPFKSKWPKTLVHKFDLKEAKKLLAKKEEDEQVEA
jgi:CRISPR-associated protein Csb1